MPLASNSQDPFALARRLRRPVWVYDTDCHSIAFANQAACELWNAQDEASLCSRDLSSGMSLTVAERLKQYQRDFVERDAEFVETWTFHPCDHPITVDVIYTGFVMPNGRMAMMCEVIGEEARTSETVRTANALLHTDVKVALFGSDGTILYHNPAARSVLPSADCSSAQLFVDPGDFPRMLQDVREKGESKFVTQIYTSSGEKWFDLRTKQCLDAASGEQAYLVTAYDVSELKATTDRAHYLAARDQLTGCYNRSIVQSDWSELGAIRRGPAYCVIYIDINKFKHINDTYGHSAGDATLKTVADRLRSHTREGDIAARIGGDEFVVLLNDASSEGDLHKRLNAIQTALQKPFEIGPLILEVGVSIGVFIKGANDPTEWSEALQRADMAMYCSKRDQLNTFTIFDDTIGAAAKERVRFEIEIAQAIANREFEVFYQPRIALSTNRVVAAEALLRWRHRELGDVSPAKFIPICEEMGVIDQIGEIVFDKVREQMSEWYRQGLGISVSLNVSPKQFQHDDFISIARRMTALADFPLSLLELEITESSFVGGETEVARRIQNVRELGFQVAIDDFGTGYSNLAHISRFPVSCIKADQTFVAQLPKSAPLLRLIFTLAKQLQSTTVAEGVETYEQLAWLRDNDCDQAQGFLFSKAIPADGFVTACQRLEARMANWAPAAAPCEDLDVALG